MWFQSFPVFLQPGGLCVGLAFQSLRVSWSLFNFLFAFLSSLVTTSSRAIMPICFFFDYYILTWDRVGTLPLTDTAHESSCPRFFSFVVKSIKFLSYTMVYGVLGFNWPVSFLFCLLTHFLKSNLSLSVSLRQYISSVHNTHWSNKQKGMAGKVETFPLLSQERNKYYFLMGDEEEQQWTAMEWAMCFFQTEPYLLFLCPRTTHMKSVQILNLDSWTW